MMAKRIFFIISIVIAFSSSYKAQVTTFCYKGTVVNYKLKNIVKDVRVMLKTSCGKIYIDSTDVNGYYFFDSVETCESYTIICERSSLHCDGGYYYFKEVISKNKLDELDTLAIVPIEKHPRIPIIYFYENTLDIKNVLIQHDEENEKIYVDSSYNYSIFDDLKSFAEFIKCNHQFNVVLSTFCSNQEMKSKNKNLSLERANKVKKELINLGVNPDLIKIEILNNTSLKYTDSDLKKTKDITEKYLKAISNQRIEIKLPFRCK